MCECDEGWGGVNCNSSFPLSPLSLPLPLFPRARKLIACALPLLIRTACKTDEACAGFRIPGWDYSTGEPEGNLTCFKGGNVVRQNYQMCDVTSELNFPTLPHSNISKSDPNHLPSRPTDPSIIKQLEGKKPQITFSCSEGPASTVFPSTKSSLSSSLSPLSLAINNEVALEDDEKPAEKTCNFQFWIASVESFFCTLDQCDWKATTSHETNGTEYRCERIRCDCVPERMLCGENGSVSEYFRWSFHRWKEDASLTRALFSILCLLSE